MLFGRIKKRRHRLVAVLGVSAAALLVFHLQARAEDRALAQDMMQGATIVAHASAGPLRCEIRKNQAKGAVELSGSILGSHAVKGSFHFAVIKSGTSGSSNIAQRNRFDLAADQETQVGLVTINLERDSLVVVELSAATDDGIECRVTTSLTP